MRAITMLLVTAFLLTACADERDVPGDGGPADASVRSGDTSPASAQPGDPDDHAGESAHGHGTAAPGSGQTLLVIMQKLGSEMASLTHGIMTEDTALVARSAAEIAAHADIAPDEVERIHAELGAGMSEFERLDAQVHEASVALHDAVRSGQFNVVLDRLHEVQRGCVECHTRFRERLRTSAATDPAN